ncbi:MAG: ferrous iron transport protein B [Candidatus Aenigmarchaeota archaeon]|nr:ferrous iron transport protein B [Candidatus Aenigmarchaeota archaeon]
MKRKLRFALAGNANVGKSVIFNYLTGLHQHIGNWPGKTVEKAEGTLYFSGREIYVIDLPGIYSLSTYSPEEIVTREYIAKEKPDVVINVIDATVLERNLFFTLQLMELGIPLVIALNQIDMAEKKGIKINHRKLEKILGIPVIPTIAVKGDGLAKVMEKAIAVAEGKTKLKQMPVRYEKNTETQIRNLVKMLKSIKIFYPKRWTAVKLIEGDKEIEKLIFDQNSKILETTKKIRDSLRKNVCSDPVTCGKYEIITDIVKKVQKYEKKRKRFSEKLHDITTDRIWGYPILIGVIGIMFLLIFTFGDELSSVIEDLMSIISPLIENMLGTGAIGKFVASVVEGIIAALTIVIPYILPFYIALGVLEDSGYLARIAFLMDTFMHKIGLHGKAFIPVMLGFGCNVPACLGCKIMETQRERLLSIFIVTLVPCAAVTTVILGLVGKFVGIWWAVLLYLLDFIIIVTLGRIAFKVLPGKPTSLIMEVPPLRKPHMRTTLRQAWFRIKDFIYVASPIIIVSTIVIKSFEIMNLLDAINEILSPVTVWWLGLPAITGITLVFGILRKEMTLIMLATLIGTTNFSLVLTPVQMITFAFVTMLYIPCAATIAALIKEIGWRKATYITIFEITFAIFMGGLLHRILLFIL